VTLWSGVATESKSYKGQCNLCAFHSVIWIFFHRVFVRSINVAKTKDFNLLYQQIYLLEMPSRANYVVGKA
jgi:hypothetical protein